jgi:hypothetical protein
MPKLGRKNPPYSYIAFGSKRNQTAIADYLENSDNKNITKVREPKFAQEHIRVLKAFIANQEKK